MWKLKEPKPVKLVVGILASNYQCLHTASDLVAGKLGEADFTSEVWPFDQTDYYRDQTGPRILRQFLSFERLIDPGKLAKIKLKTNGLEQRLAKSLAIPLPRPVNLDPGIIEPSKLVLATTKNYSHRIYIGRKMYAEVTLIYDRGQWRPLDHTYPDYRQQCYFDFFEKVRTRLLEQLKSVERKNRHSFNKEQSA
ncbi:MAG: hypothetical protein AMJ65_15595 [Phycisphaerae bacterium SG8_4]|nr:MAG: hypothetical protein AMJ65_15595 [Phycisphaerae bacterium SG8_4]